MTYIKPTFALILIIMLMSIGAALIQPANVMLWTEILVLICSSILIFILWKAQKQSHIDATLIKALNMINAGIVITNAHNKIWFVNDSFCKTCGYSKDELIGNTPKMLQSGKNDEAFYRSMFEVLRKTDQWEGDVLNKDASGKLYSEWLSISVIRSQSGKIRHYVAISKDITLQKNNEAIITTYAYHDELTGLANRRLFLKTLQDKINHYQRLEMSFSILFFDLNKFKPINDQMGHDVGDHVLLTFGKRLKSGLRENDLLARLGGDEFAAIIDKAQTKEMATLCKERLLYQLKNPIQIKGHSFHISASVGVAVFPEDGKTAEALLEHADKAMYAEKHKPFM